NWIAIEDARPCLRRVDELAAVVRQDRFVGRNARQDRFSAAREAGKQMWLNEALRKHQVGLDRGLVHNTLSPGWKRADPSHRSIVRGDVHDDLLTVDNLLSVLVD